MLLGSDWNTCSTVLGVSPVVLSCFQSAKVLNFVDRGCISRKSNLSTVCLCWEKGHWLGYPLDQVWKTSCTWWKTSCVCTSLQEDFWCLYWMEDFLYSVEDLYVMEDVLYFVETLHCVEDIFYFVEDFLYLVCTYKLGSYKFMSGSDSDTNFWNYWWWCSHPQLLSVCPSNW